MKYYSLFLTISLTVVISCEKNNVAAPLDNPDVNLMNTLSISDTVMHNIEGIYELADGSGDLGTEFVCKVSKSKVSFFSNSGGIYIILKYGLNQKDGAIEFAGFWRYSENTVQGFIINCGRRRVRFAEEWHYPVVNNIRKFFREQ